MVGHRDFELDWVSVYAFRCCRLDRFVHGRTIFVGDSAHVVSPFGARGGNGGIHDVDNLGWKLAAVLQERAPAALLDSYDEERRHGADENICNSARATSFMTPKSGVERLFRDEVLGLAADFPFARKLVNSGRLSVPCSLAGLPLQTPPEDDGPGVTPGEVCPDAPVETADGPGWLLHHLGGDFVLLALGDAALPEVSGVRALRVRVDGGAGAAVLQDRDGHVRERYGWDRVYLIRPDQHVAARFAAPDARRVRAALDRALARTEEAAVVA
jgi:3-(3-hydroxy-phenyl)propionate hydroxylase